MEVEPAETTLIESQIFNSLSALQTCLVRESASEQRSAGAQCSAQLQMEVSQIIDLPDFHGCQSQLQVYDCGRDELQYGDCDPDDEDGHENSAEDYEHYTPRRQVSARNCSGPGAKRSTD